MKLTTVQVSMLGATIAIAAMLTPATQAQSADSERASITQASVPRLVQFSGTLKDASARPVSGVASVTFAIYAEQDGGAALWSETQNVLADPNGHYSVLLGTATSGGFPAELFGTGQSRWLGVTIARQPEMPRVLMASVPYALKAGDADTLGGLPASSYVTTQQLAASNAHGATTLVNGGGTTIVASPMAASAGASPSATPNAVTQSVTQATPTGGGTTDYIPLWTSASNLGNSILFQANGKIGVGTTTPAVTLDVNGDSIFRGSFQLPPQGTATASAGQPSHSFQWEASVFDSSTNKAVAEAFGFRAVPAPYYNNTPNPAARLDLFYGPGGGTLTDTNLSIDSTGIVYFVPGQQFNGSGASLGSLQLTSSGSLIYLGGTPFLSNFGSTGDNTFLGSNAGGGSSTQGSENTAMGYQALAADTTGYYNTAIGWKAMGATTNGEGDTAVGIGALESNVSGYDNTAIGDQALTLNTSDNNIGLGSGAGDTNTTGYNNIFIGTLSNPSAGNLYNAIAIGTNAVVGANNSMVLGGTQGYSVNVGIGTSTPAHTLDVIDRGAGGAAIYATSAVAGDTAVYGVSTAASGTGSNGGYFFSSSPNGSGVVGENFSGGYGAYFAGNNYAGYFSGNVGISGTLTKGAGSFKIDDPIDPANKYLSHSFVESPDMKNIYDGTVVTDAKGYATVTMPKWFEALNRDFRYQLTTINSFSRATVSSELRDGKFRIRTSRPNVKVSWQVTGIRHDAYANAHRIPNEEEKPANEQGKYLHPELFGAGPDRAIAAMPPVSAPANAISAVPTAAPGSK